MEKQRLIILWVGLAFLIPVVPTFHGKGSCSFVKTTLGLCLRHSEIKILHRGFKALVDYPERQPSFLLAEDARRALCQDKDWGWVDSEREPSFLLVTRVYL